MDVATIPFEIVLLIALLVAIGFTTVCYHVAKMLRAGADVLQRAWRAR